MRGKRDAHEVLAFFVEAALVHLREALCLRLRVYQRGILPAVSEICLACRMITSKPLPLHVFSGEQWGLPILALPNFGSWASWEG